MRTGWWFLMCRWTGRLSSFCCHIAVNRGTMTISWPITVRNVHIPNLEGAAGADFAEPGDTVQVVGGHGLVLLLEEPEGGEGEAGVVAVSVLKHRSHLVLRTPV